MRPGQGEVIAIVQSTLQELGREAPSDYARYQANLCLMLLQSLAAELDSAAHDLASDIAALGDVLSQARDALRSLPDAAARALAEEVGPALAARDAPDLRLSSLGQRRERLLALLERFLCLCEDRLGAPGAESLLPVRRAAYRLLRRMALRGWCFWDASSFREALARWRQEAGGP